MIRVVCFIQYKIDPYKREVFNQYAKNWGEIIPRCGGQLLGYFLPDEGTNNLAFGLIGFSSLAEYESYRMKLKNDEAGKKNFKLAKEEKFIHEEQRTFLTPVSEAFLKITKGIKNDSSDF